MDVVFSDVLRDLNNFQSKIASLFEDFMKEKGYYTKNLEHLCINLKESSIEVEKLKKEVEVLREDNLNMKNIIYKGISLFKNLDISKTSKQHTNELEALKTAFIEYSKKTENSDLTVNVANKEKEGEIGNERYELTEDDIQKEIKLLKSVNFWSNDFDDDASDKNTKCALQSSCPENDCKNHEVLKKNAENNDTAKESATVPRTKSFDLDYINYTLDTEFDKSVEMLRENNKSPVFKDFNCRRHNESASWESRGLRLVDENFLEKSGYLSKSNPERSCKVRNRSPRPGSPAQNWNNKSMKNRTFKIPPNGLLKKSHSREIEKSSSGMKIMNQTFLNIERFKRKSPEEINISEDEENENGGRLSADETKTSDEEIENTFIEIPNKANQVLKDIKNKKPSRSELEEIPSKTPPLMTEPDLDETYVSASIIHKHMLERETEERTPLKRHALELPKNDFPYKEDPVRKKSERMKLPGHACTDCNKYYENALGDINTQDLKKILNKCSRHRQRYSPSLDSTPPDYWKPYLTCASTLSPNS